MTVLLILPAFNEQKKIVRTLERLRSAVGDEMDIMVIDDGSSDRTADLVRECGVGLLRLPLHLGYGAALQTGYKFALRRGYSALVQMDADGQHDPSSIRDLLQPIHEGRADGVIGNRFHAGSRYSGSSIRYAGQLFFSLLCRLFTGLELRDPTSGFRAYNRVALSFLSMDWFPQDFPDADVIVLMHRKGLRIREVPVTMHASSDGKSMHAGFFRPLYYVVRMLLSLFMVLLRKKVE